MLCYAFVPLMPPICPPKDKRRAHPLALQSTRMLTVYEPLPVEPGATLT